MELHILNLFLAYLVVEVSGHLGSNKVLKRILGSEELNRDEAEIQKKYENNKNTCMKVIENEIRKIKEREEKKKKERSFLRAWNYRGTFSL